MNKILLLLFLILPAFLSAKDNIWTNAGSAQGVMLIVNHYKDLYQKSGDYDSCWKYMEALDFYSKNYIKKEERKPYYEAAVKAGEKAIKLKPKGIEGLFWYTTMYSRLVEANMDLGGVGKILELADRIIAIDPSYAYGAAYLIKARLYHKAPGWPISAGDMNKAGENYQLAMKYGKNMLQFRVFYAEYLIDTGKKSEAASFIDESMKIKSDPLNPEHEKMKDKLKKLKEKCK